MDASRAFGWSLLLGAAVALSSPCPAASYARRENGDEAFARPLRLRLEIPRESLEVLRNYNQVWRQARPERIDVPVTVREGGRVYTNVAIHLKGSYSFQPIDAKPSLTLNFNKFAPGQSFHGLTKIHLNNSVQDPSYLNEQLARELFASVGVPAPRAGHALVSINGRDIGLCVLLEGANKQWVKRNFESAKGNLYDGGSGGDIAKALETDSGENPEDRSDLVKLRAAIKERNLTRRSALLEEVLDVEQFLNFAATEIFLVHWDGYAAGGNNYRLFHDVSRDKMIFIPGGMDQLFGISSSPSFSITPNFKGQVAKALLAAPEQRRRYLARLEQLSTNEFRVEALHARVDRLAARLRPALAKDADALQQFDASVRNLKARMTSRCLSVAQQLKAPKQPVVFAGGSELRLTAWTFKSGPTVPAAASRMVEDNRPILRITGRGPGSSGAWRNSQLLSEGRYELSGLARTEGIRAEAGMTNGVMLRKSGDREVEGIRCSDEWVLLRYEFEVRGLEDVEFVCEFRGAQGSGSFDASSLRVVRKGP